MTLAELRNKKKITQSAIADMLGIGVSTYNMYENGRRVPTEIADKIAQIFDCEVSDIFLPHSFTVRKNHDAQKAV